MNVFYRVNACLWLSICVCLFSAQISRLSAQVQVAPDRYRIEFTDKAHHNYTIEQPGQFLSERAIQRRIKQNIHITQADLPVSSFYIDSLKRMNIEVLNTSRWFNSATIRCSADKIDQLKEIDFIKQTTAIQKTSIENSTIDAKDNVDTILSKKQELTQNQILSTSSIEHYGMAANQTKMLNGQVLHNNGFRGQDMLIAVIDGDFYKTDELSGFQHLRQQGRLLAIKNFTNATNLWGTNSHGTHVLSIIASDLPGQMVGSAPDATYVLLRSEEVNSEYIVEEDNWISAVEYADSIGVDIITSSVGYSTFNDPTQNHRSEDLDGRTVRTSYAATMAAARGIIVCVSIGNDGNKSWKYASVPADADSIVAVGAVNANRQYAAFSSIGPTADGRIKPDLTAMGQGTAFQTHTGDIISSNGTSYATPLLAGFIACLWQAYPEKNNMEIIEMVKRSADRFSNPDFLYGYGIPDFSKLVGVTHTAYEIVDKPYKISVIPNPYTHTFTLYLSPACHGHIRIRIYSVTGQLLYTRSDHLLEHSAYQCSINESASFAAGTYIIEVYSKAGRMTAKAIKQ